MAGRPSKVRPPAIPQDNERELARRRALGLRVKRLREERGWSLRDMESACGINRNELMAIESGEVDPRTGTIDRIAQALGCELVSLLTGSIEEK